MIFSIGLSLQYPYIIHKCKEMLFFEIWEPLETIPIVSCVAMYSIIKLDESRITVITV